jgi:hypothetical protein
MLFEEILEYNLPDVYFNFKKIGLQTQYYLIEWIMTIFTMSLNIDVAARVWDLYMIEGLKAVYQASISILTIFKSTLQNSDFEICMLTIKGKELFKIDQEDLINHMKKTKLTDSILFDIQKLDDEYIPLYTPNA